MTQGAASHAKREGWSRERAETLHRNPPRLATQLPALFDSQPVFCRYATELSVNYMAQKVAFRPGAYGTSSRNPELGALRNGMISTSNGRFSDVTRPST